MTYRNSLFLLTLAVFTANFAPVAAHNGDQGVPDHVSLGRDPGSSRPERRQRGGLGGPPSGNRRSPPLDFRLVPSGSYDQLDPSNLDFRIWVGWSQDGKIHAAGEFVDDVYVNEYDPNDYGFILFNDHLGFQVDGDHTGGDYFFPRVAWRPRRGIKDEQASPILQGYCPRPQRTDGRFG